MAERTAEDRLREEYFDLLPEIQRIAERVETEVKFHLREILLSLEKFERVIVKSRVKECESAVASLRRRQEGATFEPGRAEEYTLSKLKDLAGVRVLAFPRSRLAEIDKVLRGVFADWISDPIPDEEGGGFKYWGRCSASDRVGGEYQIVSMLVGLFWDVEHSAIYKPIPRLKGAKHHLGVHDRKRQVLNSLAAFEEEFERLAKR